MGGGGGVIAVHGVGRSLNPVDPGAMALLRSEQLRPQPSPSQPTRAAAPIRAGNGSFSRVSPTKAATAMAISTPLCSVRCPNRQAACSTMAVTAGLRAQNTAANTGTVPQMA